MQPYNNNSKKAYHKPERENKVRMDLEFTNLCLMSVHVKKVKK